MGYLDIFGCIAFTVYGQMVIEWRMALKGDLPAARGHFHNEQEIISRLRPGRPNAT